MPFIIIEFAGQKTFGGYLEIDGGEQFSLYDGQVIKVEEGTHHLSFSSIPNTARKMNNIGASLGAFAGSPSVVAMAANNEKYAVDGNITATWDTNSIMIFTVVSDGSSHILDLPTYEFKEADDNVIQEAEDIYNEQVVEYAQAVASAKKSYTVELILCIFLGGFGIHKFYRGKIVMGLLYLFTFGLFSIGVIVDIVKLIFLIRAK